MSAVNASSQAGLPLEGPGSISQGAQGPRGELSVSVALALLGRLTGRGLGCQRVLLHFVGQQCRMLADWAPGSRIGPQALGGLSSLAQTPWCAVFSVHSVLALAASRKRQGTSQRLWGLRTTVAPEPMPAQHGPAELLCVSAWFAHRQAGSC